MDKVAGLTQAIHRNLRTSYVQGT